MKKVTFLFGILILLSSFVNDRSRLSIGTYPKPQGIENLLFYVQRTINHNTIVYTLNQDQTGKLNERQPISAYWVKYDQGGKKEPLTYIQQKYAYGLRAKLINTEKKIYALEFVSYDKKQLFLIPSSVDHKYYVYGIIQNKLSIVKNIFVHIEGGSFWLPNVKSVELTCIDPVSSETLTEIIKP